MDQEKKNTAPEEELMTEAAPAEAVEAPETAETAEAPEGAAAEGKKGKKKKSREAEALEACEAEKKELEDRYLRLMAEYDNYRRRTQKERENIYPDAVADTLKELLPVEQYGYDAVFFILLILCFAWGGDTCAYFAGRAFGKHKLCPVVSPKKTVEGAIGGVLGTMVFGVIITLVYSVAANRMEAFTRSNIGVSMYVIIALLGCVAAVLGIYGDLFASVVKRQCGIKDYGTIFPGHGGILDRFDSVMFIAPFVTMVITAVFYY